MIGTNKVKVVAQKSLQDDGIRDWDNQLINELNRDYPDWENPSQTWMVPLALNVKATNSNKGELAEKRVFDLLQELGNTRKEPMFVVHSYNFKEKVKNWKDRKNDDEKYIKGEHDFVIIHRQQGLVFLQVKAATTTRQQFALANKQLEKDKLSIQCYAGEHLNGKLKKKVNYELFCQGYVVMPNCPKPDPAYISNGIFLEDCIDIQTFSSWWDNSILPKKSPDQELYNCLVKRFVGLFHGVPYPLGSSIEKSHQVLVWNTRQQLKVLLNAAAELWITGPAGSGKTWILAEKVKQLADKVLLHEIGEKILVVCYNLPLSKMLKKQFSDHLASHSREIEDLSSVVEVKTFSKLLFDITETRFESAVSKTKLIGDAVKILETRAPQYDHIFVDECQDLIGDRWPDLFQKLWKDNDDDDSDPECKHKWFFYDANQYVGLSGNVNLKKTLKTSFKLKDVLRNTGNIFDQSKKYIKQTIPSMELIKLGHQECGLAIEWDRSLSSRDVPEKEGVKVVVKHIDVLRRNKVLEKDICILVEKKEVRDRLSSELKALNVESQDAETLFEEDHDERVVVDSFRRFKGLESKVVILYNPPFFVCEDWPVKKVKGMLYIAISRCFCYLVVITTSEGCEALKSTEGMVEGSLHVSPRADNGISLAHFLGEVSGKQSMDTQYESGPMESPTKKAYEEEGETESQLQLLCVILVGEVINTLIEDRWAFME